MTLLENTHSLAITAMGMTTSVGLSAPATCAALRAGIARLRIQENLLNRNGEPIVGSAVPGTSAARRGTERLANLAVSSYHEALSSLAPATLSRTIHLSVLLRDEPRPASDIEDVFANALTALALPSAARLHLCFDGSAGGMKALVAAQERLRREPAGIEILLGADSLLDVRVLSYLEAQGRLKSSAQPRGVIPGEAGACLVLESEQQARQRNATIYGIVSGVGVAQEPAPVGSDAPCLAQGLTQAVRSAMESAHWHRDNLPVSRPLIYSDLTGDAYHAHEWGLVVCRLFSEPKVRHPADCIGSVGAAASPLLLGMAAMALHRCYAYANHLFVLCSSDAGLRGCACVTSAGAGAR